MISRKRNWLNLFCLFMITLLFTMGCAQREAQKELELAQQARQAAQEAQAPVYAPQEYEDANTLLDQAQSQFDGGDYQEAIATAQQAASRFNDAQQAVGPVRERVEQQLSEIEDLLAQAEENIAQARQEGVLTSEQINEVADQLTALQQRMVDEISREIDQEVLENFKNEVQQVLQESENLATAHLKPEAEQAKQEIQDLIDRARELEGDTYQPDQFAAVLDQFQQLEAAEQNNQWQEMINIADQMREPLNNIIAYAQEQEAEDILLELQQQVQSMQQANVNVEAYSNALDQAMQAIQNGLNALEQEDYSTAISASEQAESFIDQANQALASQAQTLVQQAQSNLDQARGLEGAEFAQTEINTVANTIDSVQTLIDNENYLQAFRTAQQAVSASQEAIEAARSGRARQELSRVEQQFAIVHNQGGAQYAPEAYQLARQAVEELRRLMDEGNYDAVEERAEEALEQVQQAKDALEEAAAEFITDAEAAIEEARESDASEWVSMQFANAVNMKSAAENALAEDRYLASIRNSQQAIQASREAEARSYQLQARENLQESRQFIQMAQNANQDELSPLAYRNATQAVERTDNLLAQQQYQEAYQQSIDTLQLSQRAYNNMIMTAQEAVDDALLAGAMTYSREKVQQALILLTEAENAQEAHNYSIANEKAAQSIELAQQAEYETWEQRSQKLILKLEGMKETLQNYKAPERAPELYQLALSYQAAALANQIDEDYEASFENADLARETSEQFFERMNEELSVALQETQQTAEWLGEYGMNAKARELKIKLMNEVVDLEQQLKLRNWNKAYEEAEEALETAQRVTAQVEKINRDIMVSNIKSQLSPYTKQDALAIVPEQKAELEQALKTIRTAKGEPYTTAYQSYQAAQETIENLPDMLGDQAEQQTEEIASILQQAEEAGAVKYFPERYNELVTDLQWLRNSIRGDNVEEISDRLTHLEEAAPLLLEQTQLAVEENDYLEILRLNLNQANNLIQDFDNITEIPNELFLAARLTEHRLDTTAMNMYRTMQGDMTAKTLRINAEILEERVKQAEPPETLAALHNKAIKAFTLFREAAQGFEMYGDTEMYDIHYRERVMRKAFDKLEKMLEINQDLMFAVENHRTLSTWEKMEYQILNLEEELGDFYFDWVAD